MTITTFLATYGALLSTAGLGWNFYRDFHDRGKLKVGVSLKTLVTNHAGRSFAVRPELSNNDGNGSPFGYVSITNVGKRPIYVEGVAGKWKKPLDGKNEFLIIPENHLPKQLSEGETTCQLIPQLDTFSENLRGLYAYDSSGKHWDVPRKDIREAIRDARRHLQR